MLPSFSPIISAPTSSPSFIGLVISVDITTTATSNIDQAEIERLELLVAESYGVDSEDISSVTEYITTGTLTVTIPDTISENEALEDLTAALSTTLGVSEDSISLSLDQETGEVSYTITTSDYDQTNTVLSDLQNDDIIERLDTTLIVIDSVNPNDEILCIYVFSFT